MYDFNAYLNNSIEGLANEFTESKKAYMKVWSTYHDGMKDCVPNCKNLTGKTDIEGPQGIYWIGKKTRIFFIAKESLGWNNVHQYSEEATHFMPIQFTFNSFHSLSGYFGKIRNITKKLFDEKNRFSATDLLKYISLSNICKCYHWNKTTQWKLNFQCRNRAYWRREVDVVNAPIVVLFTKMYKVLHDLDPNVKYDGDIVCLNHNNRHFIELDHPGRLSHEIIERLILQLKEYLRNVPENVA